MAAMWTKYLYRGDFCVELYGGTRHGWYNRVGDLNLTVMNAANSPALGYTVTCTGWDVDHSQLFTRLFRAGVLATQTDQYAMPRLRDGNVRKVRDPLIAPGRDVHGAWYYVKLRRHGKKLEYYFDNELLMTWEDPEPIDLGSLGLWTLDM